MQGGDQALRAAVAGQFDEDGRRCAVKANWQVNCWRDAATTTFWGRYEYVLGRAPTGRWWIEKKKVLVLNDVIPVVLDVYLL